MKTDYITACNYKYYLFKRYVSAGMIALLTMKQMPLAFTAVKVVEEHHRKRSGTQINCADQHPVKINSGFNYSAVQSQLSLH